MATEITRIRNLMQGIQQKDPRMYDLLDAVVRKLDQLDTSVESVRSALSQVPAVGLPIATDIEVFEYQLTTRNVRLNWEQPDATIISYEIRLGNDWLSGIRLLITPTTTAVFDPLTVGTHTYWIKGIDINGNYSMNAKRLDVVIPPLGLMSLTGSVIDNNVLLYWVSPPSTFEISYYELYRDATLIGNKAGTATFTTIFEVTGGTFQYKIRAFDIAGNASDYTTLDIAVRQPADYALLARGESLLAGTKVNCIIENNRLVACLNLTETWATHFSSRAWTCIQDQINAGYPYYFEPGLTTGSYEEVFDFGTVLDNIIVNLLWEQNQLVGSTSILSKIATSTDGINYTSFTTAKTLFISTLRYIKVRIEFTASNDKALIEFYNLVVTLDVKLEVDSGTVQADKDDANGTPVLFNKNFKDVDSITLTPLSNTEPIEAVYDFLDEPNPTGFSVYAFDSAGQRVDFLLSWKARGIV